VSDAPPVLDVSPLVAGDAERAPEALLRDLADASARWGFFQIVGHGVPSGHLAAFDAQMRRFFALPQAEKDAVRRSADNAWGYTDGELTKQTRDCKEILDVGPVPRPELPDDHPDNRTLEGFNRWPKGLSGFAPIVKAHYAECLRVARPLLGALARTLGAPPDAFEDAFVGHSSFLRLNHYPEVASVVTSPDATPLGVNCHTDAGALTILYQDEVPGLQVACGDRGDDWVLVEPRPGALVVNLGDMLQVWSNDRYRAPLHRVLASGARDRVSAPFFYNPSYDAVVAPLDATVTADPPRRYRPVSWAEFRTGRAAGDYADLGEEIQVERYRIAG
jgi:isopenicillin N synthase-like dioxygenase